MTDNLRLGAWNALAAAALFAMAGACVKAATADTGITLVVFFRNATGLVLLLPWLLRRGTGALATQRFSGHLWRTGLGVCAMYTFFFALSRLHLAEAMVLTYSAPLFIPLLAWWAAGERPSPILLPALALGLLGVLLIAKPDAHGLMASAAAVGLLSGVFAAGAMVTIRRISSTEPAVRIVFYFSLLSTVITALPLPWTWRTPDAAALGWMLATGVMATGGQLFLTRAYTLAPAARVGAFTYAAVIFSGVIGWIAWDERPDSLSLVGMALVVACCLLAAARPRVTLRPTGAG